MTQRREAEGDFWVFALGNWVEEVPFIEIGKYCGWVGKQKGGPFEG